jgi:hypothetical protein
MGNDPLLELELLEIPVKVEMVPQLHPRRGGEVKVGHVYSNPHGRPFYKVVLGIVPETWGRSKTFNNIVMLHVTSLGEVVGSSCQPQLYVSEHQDHVGIVKNMPTLKIEWLKKENR